MQKDSDFELCVDGSCPGGEFRLASEAVGGIGV